MKKIVKVVPVIVGMILGFSAYAEEQVIVQQNGAQAQGTAQGGSTIQNKIEQKFGAFRDRIEEKLAKSLDSIDVTVNDKDEVRGKNNLRKSAVADDSENEIEAYRENNIMNHVRIFPIFGWTSMSSDYYRVSSQYSLGAGVEADVTENVSMGLSYTYTKFDISLAPTNPYYGGIVAPYGLGSYLTPLQYNQNLFDLFGKYNFLPVGAKFRPYLGVGTGLSKGYLNYKQNSVTPPISAYSGYNYSQDYEITAWTGSLLAGADVSISSKFSISADFHYYKVLSSSQNQPINNYGFLTPGYPGGVGISDKDIVGGTLKTNDFYTVGTAVKFSF